MGRTKIIKELEQRINILEDQHEKTMTMLEILFGKSIFRCSKSDCNAVSYQDDDGNLYGDSIVKCDRCFANWCNEHHISTDEYCMGLCHGCLYELQNKKY